MKKHIPNLLTLGNLLSGTIAIIFALKGDFVGTAVLVTAGIVFDFFDGFVARMLNVQGELGKQLDSLADMVTSGVVPGIVMLQLLISSLGVNEVSYFATDGNGSNLPYIGLLLTLGACYRLANFNIDTRQSDSFIGLPTPAMTLLVISLPLIVEFSNQSFFIDLITNQYFLIAVTVLLTFLMNAEIPLFALKFKSFRFKENALKYIFLALSIILLIVIKFVAVPLIILLYVGLSMFNNLKKA
ncbi:CDP-alcohol phosphatidyltransferase family protein [Tenacibaculum sp. AHE15PA]|uniref:CDP-alcohol phosphatidyltransferase family protein n=1 Tax=unclassified Tenacibaculum TaxID=2635139 RepID=UPI001C4E60B4|nr:MULTISPECIES: CDP-alcohol phosphatidyltransferase family protein [unclassified Tenacibaculum]QXP73871.1 CDP-alcohol phosphatidyltransferase family protein [Tenacibaculum sp. AHE14PA]QXP75762.1 CDP-alcohol phosphatidyltransferase family protein [Tenacibaculum sp. AHE15PA]